MPGGQQVGERRRQTQAAPPVLRKRADAARFRVIVVGDLREAEAPADLEEGTLDRDQLIRPPAADGDRAAAPVQAAGALRVVFQPTKDAVAPSPSSTRRSPAPPTHRNRPAPREARSWH